MESGSICRCKVVRGVRIDSGDFLTKFTPMKINMEPENDGSQKGISSSRRSACSVSMLVFGGVLQIVHVVFEVHVLEVQCPEGVDKVYFFCHSWRPRSSFYFPC